MSWRVVALLAPLCASAVSLRARNGTITNATIALSSSSSSSISTTTTAHLADFILQGLGQTTGEDEDGARIAESTSSSTASSSGVDLSTDSSRNGTTTPATITGATATGTPDRLASPTSTSSSSSSSPFPTFSIARQQNGTNSHGSITAFSGITTASTQGFAAASSCQTDLFSWLNASRAYISQHAAETSYHTEFSETIWTLKWPTSLASIGGGVTAASVTTLCDGNPRVVGSGQYLTWSTVTREVYTVTETHISGPYPTPAPCTIGAEECTQLHDWYETAKLKVLYANQTLYEPPCATSGSAIPSGKKSCQPPVVEGWGNFTNEVMAEHAQLLYWPVQVKDPTDDSLLCYKPNEAGVMRTAETIPGTRTGDGPNTMVTDGVTITSPMIAMVYTNVGRADGCGPHISKTIRTMQPEHLSSIRRAPDGGAPRYPFDYSHLNWLCDSGNGTWTTQYVQEGERCYQNVPAAAYFNGPQKWLQYFTNTAAVRGTEVQSWTILNDYEPYIIEEERFTKELHELYGTNAGWLQFGIWDPPVALIQHTAAAKPTLPVGWPATPTATTTQKYDPVSTPATPAHPVGTQLSETPSAVPDVISRPHTGDDDESTPAAPPQQNEGSSSARPQQGENHPAGSPNRPSNGSNNVGSGNQGNQNGEVPQPSHAPIQGDANAGQNSGQHEEQPPAPILAIGSMTLTQQPANPLATSVVFQDAKTTIIVQVPAPGGSAKAVTIDSWTLTPSAAPGGEHVFQNAETAFTVHAAPQANPTPNDNDNVAPAQTPAAAMHDANAILTLNSMTFTASPAADHEVLFNAQTTITIHMGEAATVESHEISAVMSDGLPRLAVSSVMQKQSETRIDGVAAATAASSTSPASQASAATSVATKATGEAPSETSAVGSSTGGSEHVIPSLIISIISIAFACFLL
ncbi:hypothetical protein CKM354_000078600 [Cercospora kikuchii]|uniref:Uncharacterized protein n=1 Tax=Cercospora kikuchii TaxID=84275 RepID=A0A9P3F7L2_9PEZI|nr:uncharacterized protein CKM354_000078600 [Cercospora kikuchii]GIZ37336.1 hypothetical protein CKM354_000078600 [Cercospora kikuchii]